MVLSLALPSVVGPARRRPTTSLMKQAILDKYQSVRWNLCWDKSHDKLKEALMRPLTPIQVLLARLAHKQMVTRHGGT
jgi:hypothetical protein